MSDVSKVHDVEQNKVTLEMVERWMAEGHIQSVRLPADYRERPESEITALLIRMFELPSQLDEDSSLETPGRKGRRLNPEEWGPAIWDVTVSH